MSLQLNVCDCEVSSLYIFQKFPFIQNIVLFQVLCEAIMNAAGQYPRTRSNNAFVIDLPTIHLVWAELQPRVQLVQQVLIQWPGALREILNFREENAQHVLNKGKEFVS